MNYIESENRNVVIDFGMTEAYLLKKSMAMMTQKKFKWDSVGL